jgi:hypothetical protein
MSLYFASGGPRFGIRALCGLKCIVLRAEELTQCRALITLDRTASTVTIPELVRRLLDCFDQGSVPDEFLEEYDHFRCVSASRAAAAFHARNVILRFAFSGTNCTALPRLAIQPCRVYREVVRYSLDYAAFYAAALPWLEAHHQLTSGSVGLPDVPLLSENLQSSMDYLGRLIDPSRAAPMYDIVGRLIDAAFARRHYDCRRRSASETWGAIPQRHPLHPVPFRAYASDILRTLLLPAAWRPAQRVLSKRTRTSLRYVFGRLWQNDSRRYGSRATAPLPAVLCDRLFIDPVGFEEGQPFLPRQEADFHNRSQKAQSDLLWRVLNRAAICSFFVRNQVPEGDVRVYFKLLRDFLRKALHRQVSVEAIQILAAIDNDILDWAVAARGLVGRRDADTRREISHWAVAFFNLTRSANRDLLADEASGFGQALNASYMHL